MISPSLFSWDTLMYFEDVSPIFGIRILLACAERSEVIVIIRNIAAYFIYFICF